MMNTRFHGDQPGMTTTETQHNRLVSLFYSLVAAGTVQNGTCCQEELTTGFFTSTTTLWALMEYAHKLTSSALGILPVDSTYSSQTPDEFRPTEKDIPSL